jgi:hypothetical protein
VLRKIATKDVTEAIAKAMEHADDIQNIVILYETHEDNKITTGEVIVNDECTMSKMNFLLDLGKWWIFKGEL